MMYFPAFLTGLGWPEILLILALVLVLFGPKRLPEIAEAMGDKRSFGCLPSVVSRHAIVAPCGVGTSQATQPVVATRVIKVPHRGPNENGSRLAIQRAIATVAAIAAPRATGFFGRLSRLILTGWSLLLGRSG